VFSVLMKNQTNKISKKSPSYYVPMPYAMAIHRSIPKEDSEKYLFKGMQLHLKKMEIPSMSIAVTAHYNGTYNFIGFIPNGMISRISELLQFEDSLVVSLECVDCKRLANTFWITIDQLPTLDTSNLF